MTKEEKHHCSSIRKKTAAGKKKADMRFAKNTVWHRIQYPHWKSLDQHSHHDKHGWVGNMKHIKKKISPTNLIPTLQKHITSKHSSVMNMAAMYRFFLAAEWWMQQRCYFWRGMKTYFSSLLMMLICSQSPNMQMKCATTIKWIVLRRWGRFKQHVCKIETAHNFVTCAALCVCVHRAVRWHVTNRHSTRSHVWVWCLGWNFWTISS